VDSARSALFFKTYTEYVFLPLSFSVVLAFVLSSPFVLLARQAVVPNDLHLLYHDAIIYSAALSFSLCL
jgi:hypothetical protein